ncbi:hypothetical protein F5888DRAFT_1904208 [Russula emetica]|nr:hypothetical protein F5888DRAFT_1904208 [Russula emetica]
MSARSDPDQCALDENGQLKDANNIQWFNSPSDKTPIPLPPVEGVEGETVTDVGAPHTRPQQNELGESAGCAESGPSGLGRIQRSGRGRKMAEALEYEKADNDGNPIKRLTTLTVRPPRKSRQVKKQRIDTTDMGASSDEDDCDYQDTEPAELESESSSPSEGDCQDTLPSCHRRCFVRSLTWCFGSRVLKTLCPLSSYGEFTEICNRGNAPPLVDGWE